VTDTPTEDDEDQQQECGYVFDHDTETVDEETGQWVCCRCGAEGWDELDD
jgi:hypothetical protein